MKRISIPVPTHHDVARLGSTTKAVISAKRQERKVEKFQKIGQDLGVFPTPPKPEKVQVVQAEG